MILTVTPNPAIDSTWRVDGVLAGQSHRVPTGTHRAGGKGINVARVLASQSLPVAIVTTAGGAAGERFTREIEASGIDHTIVPVAAETRSSLAFYDRVADDTLIFNEAGIDNTAEEWRRLVAAITDRLTSSSVLVLSGSLPGSADPAVIATIVKAASERGVTSVVETSGDGLLIAARAGASVLKPNRHELLAATGEHDVAAAARRLIDDGAGSVVVSLGAEGLLLIPGDNAATPRALLGHPPLRAWLAQPLSGNPTGAGDAAVAAIAASLLAEDAPTELVRRATAWSAAAVLSPVAGEISDRHTELASRVAVAPFSPTSDS